MRALTSVLSRSSKTVQEFVRARHGAQSGVGNTKQSQVVGFDAFNLKRTLEQISDSSLENDRLSFGNTFFTVP